jgi:hypothetical protein
MWHRERQDDPILLMSAQRRARERDDVFTKAEDGMIYRSQQRIVLRPRQSEYQATLCRGAALHDCVHYPGVSGTNVSLQERECPNESLWLYDQRSSSTPFSLSWDT